VRVVGVDGTRGGWVAIALDDGRFAEDFVLPPIETDFDELGDSSSRLSSTSRASFIEDRVSSATSRSYEGRRKRSAARTGLLSRRKEFDAPHQAD
jgi:hypothetical protein